MSTNFNDTTPSAPSGGVNVKFQTDGSGNDSAYVPSGSFVPAATNLPVTVTAVSGEALTAYDATTGLFTQATVGGGGSTVITPFVERGHATNTAQSYLAAYDTVAVFPFNIPYSQLVTNIILSTNYVTTALMDVGIYSLTGTLLGHCGATSFSDGGTHTAATFTLLAPITLAPGTYLLALTCGSGGSSQYYWWGESSVTGDLFLYSTATASTGGALPSTVTVATSAIGGTPAAVQLNPPLFILT